MTESTLQAKELKDLKVLVRFTGIYCGCHHRTEKAPFAGALGGHPDAGLGRIRVCRECQEFLDYAIQRRLRCPLEPKPTCKHCQIHCYRAGHREKVREIMKFSGPYLIRRGRLDLLWHYFF